MYYYDIPFVPSSDNAVQTMLKVAGHVDGEEAIDLGAGDGKLVIALAQKGAIVTGVEIDDGRCELAKSIIISEGLQDKAKIVHGSFWEQDLSPYDLIVLYGVPSIMRRLKNKILNEAKTTCRVISNHFEFPNWQPDVVKDHVYLYRLGPSSKTA